MNTHNIHSILTSSKSIVSLSDAWNKATGTDKEESAKQALHAEHQKLQDALYQSAVSNPALFVLLDKFYQHKEGQYLFGKFANEMSGDLILYSRGLVEQVPGHSRYSYQESEEYYEKQFQYLLNEEPRTYDFEHASKKPALERDEVTIDDMYKADWNQRVNRQPGLHLLKDTFVQQNKEAAAILGVLYYNDSFQIEKALKEAMNDERFKNIIREAKSEKQQDTGWQRDTNAKPIGTASLDGLTPEQQKEALKNQNN
jgi:hypothetical protein